MTQTKFTPGPWSQSHRECHGGGYRTQVYPTNDPDNTIASLHWHVVKIPSGFTTNREANAHLIAAAPELYEAVMAIIAWDDSEESGPDYGTLTRDTHPDGESIWREWYDRNLASCERAFKLAHKSASKARGES